MWTFGTLRAGFGEAYQDGKNFLTPEAGSNFERQKFTTTKSITTGSLALKYEDYLLFKQFYKDTKQGENKFTYPDCRFGDRQASFYGNWNVQESNGYWIVGLSLILDPITYNTNVALSYNGNVATYNDNIADLEVQYEL